MTKPEADRIAPLAGLIDWAEQRERLSHDRADLVAAAWRNGTRNVAELARISRVSRDTIYADLRSRGIDPTQRTEAVAGQHQNAPTGGMSPSSLRALARLVTTAVRANPAETGGIDDLTRVVAGTSALLELVADLLDPPTDQGPGWTAADLLPHVVLQAYSLAGDAGRAMSARSTADDIARYTRWLRTGSQYTGRQMTIDRADIALRSPDGTAVAATIETDDAGHTTLTSDDSIISGTVTVLDQLELFHGLALLGAVAGRHLDPAAHIPRRTDAVPGAPPVRQRCLPSNET